jgi:ribonuclease J
MSGKLRIIPLGGLGEIGKNMMYIEYQGARSAHALLVDTGIMFPENDMLGVDYIIPDFRPILDKVDLIRAVIITHGHEDHTGAITHVMEHVNAPIYATSLTSGLLEEKLRRGRMLERVELNTVQAGEAVHAGPFAVELFHVCHSIPDSVGLGISTPAGLIVHSGDFKFDHTPVDGWPTDFSKLADFARRDVLALLADSTNADKPGWTPSESVIDGAFDEVFRAAPGRIIVASFASLISRIQQVANAAMRYGRKMMIAGTSMRENVKIARRLGYLDVPDNLIVDFDAAKRLPPEQIVIMATGSQGEPLAVMGKIATGRHNQIQIQPNDTVIMSADPIPGNEEMVHRIINRLFQRGADVVYHAIAPVHVSGHASQDEMKLLINMVRPQYFVPIHGELRHLHQHARLAMTLGIPPENIAVVENGTVLEFDKQGMHIGERVPGGYVFVDGAGVGDVSPGLLRDREILAQDGMVVVNLVINSSRAVLNEPEVVSRGFVHPDDAGELIETIKEIALEKVSKQESGDSGALRDAIEKAIGAFLYKEIKRRPAVFALVTEI